MFSEWGAEFPIFDDVIDMLEEAEQDLLSELKGQSGDEPIAKERSWKFGTARLVVVNGDGAAGMHQRELLAFLGGLREVGMQHGFWRCNLRFLDSARTVRTRAIGFLALVRRRLA